MRGQVVPETVDGHQLGVLLGNRQPVIIVFHPLLRLVQLDVQPPQFSTAAGIPFLRVGEGIDGQVVMFLGGGRLAGGGLLTGPRFAESVLR